MKESMNGGKFRWKQTAVILILMTTIGGFSAISSGNGPMDDKKEKIAVKRINKDSIISAKAFLGAYQVLMHPACMNCHPKGDIPLQGNDSHLHTMGVRRGPDGKGVSALKCANCHQTTNLPGPHMPPGHKDWHLPPANMKMVFQGRTPRELARQLLDPRLNGGKSKKDLIIHASEDKLVQGSWDHGEGHAAPPISHAEFARLVKLWIDKGAYLPPANIPALHK